MNTFPATPLRSGFVPSSMTAWAEVSAIAGEILSCKTPRVGGFRNDPINPFYKDGYRLASGEILVIQHERISGDMKVNVFANREAQQAYEAEADKMVADPETGRREALTGLATSEDGVAEADKNVVIEMGAIEASKILQAHYVEQGAIPAPRKYPSLNEAVALVRQQRQCIK